MPYAMKNFTPAVGRTITAFLMLFMLAGGLFLAAGEARAADKPKWLETKIVEWSVIKSDKVTDISKPGYCLVKVKMRHTNKSSAKIVTALYDKKLKVSLDWGTSLGTATLSGSMKSTKVNRVSLDPGESHTVTYTVRIADISPGYNWAGGNKFLLDRQEKKKLKFSYDLKVKSEGI